MSRADDIITLLSRPDYTDADTIYRIDNDTIIIEVPVAAGTETGHLVLLGTGKEIECYYIDELGDSYEVDCEDPFDLLEVSSIEYDTPTDEEYKWVIRNRKKIRKLVCQQGYKAVGSRCIRMTARQVDALRRAGQRLARAARRIAKLKSTKLKRSKSNRLRRILVR